MAPRLAELPQPAIPDRPVVQAMLINQPDINAGQQMQIYDAAISAIQSGTIQPGSITGWGNWNCPPFVDTCKAWRGGDYAKAAVKFQDNLRDKTEWTVAWFGWLLCEFALGHADVVIQNNLQLNGVKLLPYSPADESAFIALSQGDRDDLVGQFQSAMRGIGDLYAASGLVQSRAQVSQSREEYRQAA